jgi:selenocysteine-specific elongation factor
MPQTREHAAVLAALGVRHGVVAVTKSDLADPELAMIEAAELLPRAEVVAVSVRTGAGLSQLRDALDRVAAELPGRRSLRGDARLHIDRVFTIRGAGTVITGTLWSGAIGAGDEVLILPGDRRARVRAVQVHDRALERAQAGQRVAVNLAGVAVSEVTRGDVISTAADLRPTYRVDCELRFGDREPDPGERVQVHHGTREAPARAAWLGGRFWQLRLERPLIAARGDRLVIRQIAPPDTLGGGTALDPGARKHGPSRDLLARLEALSRGEAPAEADPGRDRRGHRGPESESATPALEASRGRPPGALPESALALERRLREAGFEPPLESELDAEDLAALRAAGRAVRVSKTLHYHPEALSEVRSRVVTLAGDHGGAITLGQVRDELGTSRKFAQALLGYLDAERVTIRRGEAHHLRQSSRPR